MSIVHEVARAQDSKLQAQNELARQEQLLVKKLQKSRETLQQLKEEARDESNVRLDERKHLPEKTKILIQQQRNRYLGSQLADSQGSDDGTKFLVELEKSKMSRSTHSLDSNRNNSRGKEKSSALKSNGSAIQIFDALENQLVINQSQASLQGDLKKLAEFKQSQRDSAKDLEGDLTVVERATSTKMVPLESAKVSEQQSKKNEGTAARSFHDESEEQVPYISYQVLKEELVKEASQITDYERYQDFILQRVQASDNIYITPFELNQNQIRMESGSATHDSVERLPKQEEKPSGRDSMLALVGRKIEKSNSPRSPRVIKQGKLAQGKKSDDFSPQPARRKPNFIVNSFNPLLKLNSPILRAGSKSPKNQDVLQHKIFLNSSNGQATLGKKLQQNEAFLVSQLSDKKLVVRGEDQSLERRQQLLATQKQVTPGYTLLILKDESNEHVQGSVSERHNALKDTEKNVENLTFMNTGPQLTHLKVTQSNYSSVRNSINKSIDTSQDNPPDSSELEGLPRALKNEPLGLEGTRDIALGEQALHEGLDSLPEPQMSSKLLKTNEELFGAINLKPQAQFVRILNEGTGSITAETPGSQSPTPQIQQRGTQKYKPIKRLPEQVKLIKEEITASLSNLRQSLKYSETAELSVTNNRRSIQGEANLGPFDVTILNKQKEEEDALIEALRKNFNSEINKGQVMLNQEMGTTIRLIQELNAITPVQKTKYGRQFMEMYQLDRFVSVRDSAPGKKHGNFQLMPSEDIGFKKEEGESHFEKPKLSGASHRAQRILDVLTHHLRKPKQDQGRNSPRSPQAVANITPQFLALDMEEQGKQSGLSGSKQTPILAINKVQAQKQQPPPPKPRIEQIVDVDQLAQLRKSGSMQTEQLSGGHPFQTQLSFAGGKMVVGMQDLKDIQDQLLASEDTNPPIAIIDTKQVVLEGQDFAEKKSVGIGGSVLSQKSSGEGLSEFHHTKSDQPAFNLKQDEVRSLRAHKRSTQSLAKSQERLAARQTTQQSLLSISEDMQLTLRPAEVQQLVNISQNLQILEALGQLPSSAGFRLQKHPQGLYIVQTKDSFQSSELVPLSVKEKQTTSLIREVVAKYFSESEQVNEGIRVDHILYILASSQRKLPFSLREQGEYVNYHPSKQLNDLLLFTNNATTKQKRNYLELYFKDKTKKKTEAHLAQVRHKMRVHDQIDVRHVPQGPELNIKYKNLETRAMKDKQLDIVRRGLDPSRRITDISSLVRSESHRSPLKKTQLESIIERQRMAIMASDADSAEMNEILREEHESKVDLDTSISNRMKSLMSLGANPTPSQKGTDLSVGGSLKKIIDRKNKNDVMSQILSPISSMSVLPVQPETPTLSPAHGQLTLDFLERQVAQSKKVTPHDFDHSRSSIYTKIKRGYMGENSQKERHRQVREKILQIDHLHAQIDQEILQRGDTRGALSPKSDIQSGARMFEGRQLSELIVQDKSIAFERSEEKLLSPQHILQPKHIERLQLKEELTRSREEGGPPEGAVSVPSGQEGNDRGLLKNMSKATLEPSLAHNVSKRSLVTLSSEQTQMSQLKIGQQLQRKKVKLLISNRIYKNQFQAPRTPKKVNPQKLEDQKDRIYGQALEHSEVILPSLFDEKVAEVVMDEGQVTFQRQVPQSVKELKVSVLKTPHHRPSRSIFTSGKRSPAQTEDTQVLPTIQPRNRSVQTKQTPDSRSGAASGLYYRRHLSVLDSERKPRLRDLERNMFKKVKIESDENYLPGKHTMRKLHKIELTEFAKHLERERNTDHAKAEYERNENKLRGELRSLMDLAFE